MKGHGLIPGLIQRSFVGPRVFTLGTHSINFYSPNIYGDELASGIIGPAGNPIALLADLAHNYSSSSIYTKDPSDLLKVRSQAAPETMFKVLSLVSRAAIGYSSSWVCRRARKLAPRDYDKGVAFPIYL
ncbi:hypothetical protein TWF103_004344 [Orbilia oligospora]|nr:hypothetical protein TWF103_004344 [Orbilia oligospora]